MNNRNFQEKLSGAGARRTGAHIGIPLQADDGRVGEREAAQPALKLQTDSSAAMTVCLYQVLWKPHHGVFLQAGDGHVGEREAAKAGLGGVVQALLPHNALQHQHQRPQRRVLGCLQARYETSKPVVLERNLHRQAPLMMLGCCLVPCDTTGWQWHVGKLVLVGSTCGSCGVPPQKAQVECQFCQHELDQWKSWSSTCSW